MIWLPFLAAIGTSIYTHSLGLGGQINKTLKENAQKLVKKKKKEKTISLKPENSIYKQL